MTIDLSEIPWLRQSERAAFKRCNWAWYQEYVKLIRPIVERNKSAADFGTLIHIALATYYIPGVKRGPHPAETFDGLAKTRIEQVRTVDYTNDEQVAEWVDFRELGIELMEGYVDHYRGDPHWDVLDAERRFDVVIPDIRHKPLVSEKGRRGYRPMVVLVGTFDLCVRDLNDGNVKMIDHKTAAQIITHHLTLDEQASTYIAVANNALLHQGLINKGDIIAGMEYNFIRKSHLYKEPLKEAYVRALWEHYQMHPEDTPTYKWEKSLKAELKEDCELLDLVVHGEPVEKPVFVREFVPRTHAENQRQIVRISEEAQVMDMVRKGTIPLLKTPQKDCYFCKFYDLCEIDESGGDAEYFAETTMKPHDPYSDHREGADNSKKIDE